MRKFTNNRVSHALHVSFSREGLGSLLCPLLPSLVASGAGEVQILERDIPARLVGRERDRVELEAWSR